MNALAALAAAHAAASMSRARCRRLATSASVARRMELVGEVAGVRVYDDFAHHPTAIATTLAGLARARRRRAHPGRHGAALEFDAHGRARGRARAVAARCRRGGVPASAPNCRGMRSASIAALAGRGRTAPSVDALIAALRGRRARRRPRRLHVQRRLRRRAAAFRGALKSARRSTDRAMLRIDRADPPRGRYPCDGARTTLTSVALTDLPLFPLSTVLFPGGPLSAAHLRAALSRPRARLRAPQSRFRRLPDPRRPRSRRSRRCPRRSARWRASPISTRLPDGLLGITRRGRRALPGRDDARARQRPGARRSPLLAGRAAGRGAARARLAGDDSRTPDRTGRRPVARRPNASATTMRAGSASASPKCCRWRTRSGSSCCR